MNLWELYKGLGTLHNNSIHGRPALCSSLRFAAQFRRVMLGPLYSLLKVSINNMPKTDFDQIAQDFSFLKTDWGYIAKSKSVGSGIMVEYSKDDKTLVVIGSDDMGTGFPYAVICITENDGKRISLELEGLANTCNVRFSYPRHEELWASWWPKSWYIRIKYGSDLAREYEKRVRDLAEFLKENYQRIVRGEIESTPKKRRPDLKAYIISRSLTFVFLLLIPTGLFVLFPSSNYWWWSMMIPVVHIIFSYKNWEESVGYDQMEAIMSRYSK